MRYSSALDSVRWSLKYLNRLITQNKKRVKNNDFKTNVAMKTLIDIPDVDFNKM